MKREKLLKKLMKEATSEDLAFITGYLVCRRKFLKRISELSQQVFQTQTGIHGQHWKVDNPSITINKK